MTHMLRVEIVNFEGAVVDVSRGIRTEKESMMIHGRVTEVQMCKTCDDLFLPFYFGVGEVRGDNIEVGCVKGQHLFELGSAEAEMAKLHDNLV